MFSWHCISRDYFSDVVITVSLMRPSVALKLHRDSIREIALRHRVKNVRVFGSVLHGNDTEDSDLDLLVEPTDETTLRSCLAKD
jgi:predicted nucleotidyltransferase